MEKIHEIQLTEYEARQVSGAGALRLGTWDSYGVEKIHIVRDEAWQGLAVRATFAIDQVKVQALFDGDDMVDVPPEATSVTGQGTIVFDGTAENQRVITKNLNYRVDDHTEI